MSKHITDAAAVYATSYCIAVTIPSFLALTRYEDVHYNDESLDSDMGTNAHTLSVEYNGHFGANIFYTLDAEYDTPEAHAKITAMVASHLDRAVKWEAKRVSAKVKVS